MSATVAETRTKYEEYLRENVESIYAEVTDGLRRQLRVAELVYAVADRYPGLLPTRAEIDEERRLPQKEKQGREIDQGILIAHVLANPRIGFHLIHAMSQPRAEALARLGDFQRTGSADLGPVQVDREGVVGSVTLQNHAFLNAEDDLSTAALEVAVDLVLLDPAIGIGVLRGGPATHPKHAGRRIFGSGINLTHLYNGKISLVEFMLERELGSINKIYRGHRVSGGDPIDPIDPDGRREKPWIASVDAFAIGGACQWLLVMDRVIAESGAYFSLPARKEGIIPGCAGLRLPRFVGERLTRQAIFFSHVFMADSAEGRLIADEVVPTSEMDVAVERSVTELTAAGVTAVLGNRTTLRLGQEPLDLFRRYMSDYAREQAFCLYSTALIDNLERNWLHRKPAGAKS